MMRWQTLVTTDELATYQFRDPGAVAAEVFATRLPRAGDAYLVLVRHPSRLPRIEHVTAVDMVRWRSLERYDRSFLLAEIAGDSLYFETISRQGAVVDKGTIVRRAAHR